MFPLALLLVIIHNDSGPESGRTKYLLTSDLELTTRGVVQFDNDINK